MKGKGSFYYAIPNLGRLRSRLEAPEKTLTSEIRAQFQKVCVGVLNDNNLKIRAAMIEYIQGRNDLKFKTPEHKKQVENLFSGIFDSCFAIDQQTLNSMVGADEDDADGESAGDAAEEKPAEKKEAKAKTEKKADTKPADAKPENEEFD